MLGWGEATISRYESKAIQDEAYDTMLRLIKDNPLQALEFLKKNSDKFSSVKYQEIKEKIMEKMDAYGMEFLSRQPLEGAYAEFDEPSESNGYTLLNIDKIEAMTSYLAEQMTNFYKAKEIVDYMHEERAYKETGNGQIIPFSLAKEIREFV